MARSSSASSGEGSTGLELGDESILCAELELGIDSGFDGTEPELLQACRLRGRERGIADVRERLAAPERQGGSQQVRSVRWLGGARGRDQLLERAEVELAGLDPEAVAGAPGLDPLAAERLPEAVNRDLERVRGGLGRILAPERVHEAVARHDFVRAEEEEGEESPLPAAGEGHGLAVPQDLEGSEDPEPERHP
jgi:hypothetical protein